MPQNIKPENVNNSFFDGYYKDIWRHFFPEKTTKAEVDFIVEEARLNPGSDVLDLMCGYGRHALEFARRKINVTAVDNLPDYINEIKEKSISEGLPLQSICTDVLEMQIDKEYDVVICMGNSLQFFNEEDVVRLLSNLSEHLKAKGKLFFLTESKFLFHPTRIETNSIIITDAGEKEEKMGIDFIYSISELESIFNKTGFQLK